MPNERPIEKLLQAFALKRREQAGGPLELHPATRRMLQGEVSRQYRRPGRRRTGLWQSGAGLWPRFAFGCALLAVLITGAFLFFPPEEEGPVTLTLAKHDLSVAVSELEQLKQPVAPASDLVGFGGLARGGGQTSLSSPADAPVLALNDRFGRASPIPLNEATDRLASQPVASAGLAGRTFSSPAESPSATVASLPPPAAVGGVQGPPASVASYGVAAEAKPAYRARAEEAPAESRAPSVGSAAAPAAVAKSLPPGAKGGEEIGSLSARRVGTAPVVVADSTAPLMRNFARSDVAPDRQAGTLVPGQIVLTSFQFEQRGRAIRIVDRDGSVYTGTLQPVTVSPTSAVPNAGRSDKYGLGIAPAGSRSNTSELRVAAGPESSRQMLPFTVSGTNLTLNQQVVFVGNVLPAPGGFPYSFSNQEVGVATVPQRPGLVENSRMKSFVTGRARLADGTEVRINATPTSR